MNRKPKISKKIYVANLPLQTSEPELRALFSSAGRCDVCQDRKGQTDQPTKRICLCGDVYPMGGPKGCLHVESKKLHGKGSYW